MTLKHLSDMGVRTADDMQFIKEDDLRHLLPPVDCRKLLCAFMKRGESILGAKKWMLSIEGKVVLQLSDHSDFASALAVFFGSYYVFNIEYPAEAATSLEFIQRLALFVHSG
ncbi:hypothetical protein MHYP_G00342880 [Metynnis hypsauchen]